VSDFNELAKTMAPYLPISLLLKFEYRHRKENILIGRNNYLKLFKHKNIKSTFKI
jgi:hypothetical protein